MRGTSELCDVNSSKKGIIPVMRGTSAAIVQLILAEQDHPRHAGNIMVFQLAFPLLKDHPRHAGNIQYSEIKTGAVWDHPRHAGNM